MGGARSNCMLGGQIKDSTLLFATVVEESISSRKQRILCQKIRSAETPSSSQVVVQFQVLLTSVSTI